MTDNMRTRSHNLWARLWFRVLIGAGLASGVGAFMWVAYWPDGEIESGSSRHDSDLALGLMDAAEMSTPFIMPGIERPETFSATDVEIEDDTEVLGIHIAGRHRAYVVAALSTTSSHVVNDLIAETAVSVTYCDRTNCTRILTKSTNGNTIELMVGGFMDGKMAVQLDGVFYPQDSKDIPLTDVPFERTTWKKWKASHPETDVFTGSSPAPSRQNSPSTSPN